MSNPNQRRYAERLKSLIEDLREKGVKIVGEIEEYEYGKFAHILDSEGRKIELWVASEELNEEQENINR